MTLTKLEHKIRSYFSSDLNARVSITWVPSNEALVSIDGYDVRLNSALVYLRNSRLAHTLALAIAMGDRRASKALGSWGDFARLVA